MNQLFEHTFIDNQASQTLVLLHGTGGTQSDFLFLDTLLNHSFNLLALQGNVQENGMSRFFKRLALGVFDQESIKTEAEKLHDFMTHWQKDHGKENEAYVYLGYSNGANMILATLFYFPALINTAVLLHPMLPFTPTITSLKGKRVFVSHGQNDPMVTQQQQNDVTTLLQEKGVDVVQKNYAQGHQISRQEMQDIIDFLRSFSLKKEKWRF